MQAWSQTPEACGRNSRQAGTASPGLCTEGGGTVRAWALCQG